MSIIDKLRKRSGDAGVTAASIAGSHVQLTEGTDDDGAKLRPEQVGMWYLKQAMDAERTKVKDARKSTQLAWRVSGVSWVITAIAIITSGVVTLHNKPNPPAVLMMNENSGEIRQLRTLTDGKIPITQANDIFNLRRYIAYRESYDWEQIQDMFDATILLSSPEEGKLYKADNSEQNKLAPVNVLKDKFRVIATAGTVSFVGKTAIVSFTKKTIPVSGVVDKPPVEYYQATIAYEYEDTPMDDRDRGINPAGFKVTSYHISRDITKSTAVATASAGGTP